MQDLECLFTTLGMHCIKEFLMRALCLLKNYWQSFGQWWIEDTKVPRVFVCSDSAAALMALKGGRSKVCPEILLEMLSAMVVILSFAGSLDM